MVSNNNPNKTIINTRASCRSSCETKLPYKQIRNYCLSVRFNDKELTRLNEKRGHYHKGKWLRLSLINTHPVVVPAINIEAWKALSDLSQKLNKIVTHLDNKSSGSQLTQAELFAVKRQIADFRLHLFTADLWRDSDEGNATDPPT